MAAITGEVAPGINIVAQFPRKLDFLLERKARYKVLYGGRGGAKSWAIARALLIRGIREPGLRVLCTREVQSSMLESVHQLLRDQIVSLGLSAFYRVLKDEIRGPGGTSFRFKGLSDPEALKSAEGVDVTWVEEARNVSKDSWDKLIPTIRKAGSEVWISFNAELEGDETYKRFVLTQRSNAIVVKVNWSDNPWFPDVLREEMITLRDNEDTYDDYLNIYEGFCKAALEGAVYAKEMRRVTKESRICRFPFTKGKPVQTFWDLGRSDLTAIWFVQMFGLENRIPRYYANSGEHIDHYIEYLRGLERDEGYVLGTMWLPHDAKEKRLQSKRTTWEQLEDAGFKVRMVPKIGVSEGIQAARTIFPQCFFHELDAAEGLNALRYYRYGVKATEGGETRSKNPIHDWASNGADAFRYMGVALQEEPQKKKHVGPSNSSLPVGPLSWMGR